MAAAHSSDIIASQHLEEDRWPQRATPNTGTPLEAWQRGYPLTLSAAHMGQNRTPDHDEARVDPETMTVLFRVHGTLVTCYDLDQDPTNDAGRATLEAARAQYPELITDE